MSPRRALLLGALLALTLAGCTNGGCELPGSDDDSERSTVAGRVRIAGSDSVLAGVRVTGTYASREDVTDASGGYTLHFEWPERTIAPVNIRFAKSGFTSLDTVITVASGVPRGLNVWMSRGDSIGAEAENAAQLLSE